MQNSDANQNIHSCFAISGRLKNSQSPLFIGIGAGEGNRTLVSALGRPHSTIEPHPPACASARHARTVSIKLSRGWQLVCRRVSRRRLQTARWLRAVCLRSIAAVPGRDDFSAVQFAHIKTVNRRAAFGHDARAGNVHRQFGKRLRNRVEQAQLVFGFNLDERARFGSLVVEINFRRHPLARVGLNKPGGS